MNTRTKTQVVTRAQVIRALSHNVFSGEEEMVMRMLYGISLSPSDSIDYQAGQDEELAAKLALMEASLLEEIQQGKDPQLDQIL